MAGSRERVCLLFYVCVVSLGHALFTVVSYREPKYCRVFPTRREHRRCTTCRLFRPKQVTLVVRNILSEPTFEESVKLKCTRSETLFFMMIDAADVNPAFRFSVSYDHANHPGFFVNAFNGLHSQWHVDRTWWEILDGDLKHTPVGVSAYVPRYGETVTFNFTQSSGHG